MSNGEPHPGASRPVPDTTFVSLQPAGAAASALWGDVWQRLRMQARSGSPAAEVAESGMEAGVSVIAELAQAPSRTLHSAAVVSSSPLPPHVRRFVETSGFGRRFDAMGLDLEAVASRLPALACPAGDVQFPACDRSFDELALSVDALLQHRKRLVAPSIDRNIARRHALVVGAGPGGLMAAIQLRLRDHHVVVCEQRETYARNRYIGIYKEVTHLLAALGMPESMTYDFSQYRGKRGVMLADVQTFLHAIALKLGVVVYMGAAPRHLSAATLQAGEIELQRATRGAAAEPASIGITRWRYDTVARVRSGVAIRFDTIVEASGGRSGLRELLVGADNVVSLRTIGRAAAADDPSLESFFADPEDHSAEYVESGYGCPPGLRESFAAALMSGSEGGIPDSLPCFVSNIDASIFTRPMRPTAESMGLASRIGDRDLEIPHDWVVLECRLADQSLSRYHIEGPLPQSFEFGGKRIATRDVLDKLNPVSLLLRILYAMGVPFDAVDRRRLVDFYTRESSYGDTSDIVTTWVGTFRGLRLGAAANPIWCGPSSANPALEYAIIGEALQNAWYRFGVGVDDAFAGASRYAECLELAPAARLAEARRFERVMTARSVQILYHLYAVARNTAQGVVGPVLTEYYMDEQHGTDLAEARLREAAQQGAEMLAAASDVQADPPDALLDAAIDHLRESACRRVVGLLESFDYPAELVARARQPAKIGGADWRDRTLAVLEPALSAQHREMLGPLFARPQPAHRGPAGEQRRAERLIELGLGRYGWVSPWLRACALRALDAASAPACAALERACADGDPMVCETAAAVLSKQAPAAGRDGYLTIDKVIVLRDVNLFRAIPHQVLAGVAALLTERWVEAAERVFTKGELGDCLYVIASGRVRVHDAERSLQELGEHRVFGELSLLDAQPRAASVTAVERTRLFRLSQADFYALMSERPDITEAINRALCAMVRTANDATGAAHAHADRAAAAALA